MKKQVVVIHGGGVFINYKEYIAFLKKQEIDLKKMVAGKDPWEIN